MSGQEQKVCCESKKTFTDDKNGTYTFQGGITTPPEYLYFPPWSLPFGLNNGGYGLSATIIRNSFSLMFAGAPARTGSKVSGIA